MMSDYQCPACFGAIDITSHFWNVVVHDENTAAFEYDCEHCGAKLKIETVPEPVFTIELKDDRS